ncbi:MAG TPA: DNA-directed RNA polymerase subunit beta', partial [Acidimicrobiales bacterium]|nr:DNA-directed RNA polymerase subunit beta' [Acidimicrobiales bacterium]
MLDVNDFDQIRIGLATANGIRMWSNGEVKKPETINYRTLKPEKDGLFCEKIFGPTKDWECYCGKYKRVRFKGIICERCGVEVTRSKVRRERMGHIELAAPAVHIWYLRGTRSWLAYLLMGTEPREELKAKQLEKVIYFAANMVVSVDEERRHEDLTTLEAELDEERVAIEEERDGRLAIRQEALEAELAELEGEGAKEPDLRARQRAAEKDLAEIRTEYLEELDLLSRAWDEFSSIFSRQIIDDERLWREMVDRWGEYFDGGMGADAIARLIELIDFDNEEVKLRSMIDPPEGQKPLSVQRKQKAIKRLKIVAGFNRRDEHGRRVNEPRAMILDAVPVIPPDLRPMVQLDGGRFATSDLNDLYRRVINRNNRLKRLLDLGAPEIIVNNEKRMLQEAVDALFDNGRRGRPVTGPGNRPLKSLSDMLKGKQGRFRQNLLGKRVDYSGRSVIVAGPTLRFHQCGLPKIMALELYKPFVMKKLVDEELAPNIKSAKRMVERRRPQVWSVLGDVIQEHPVMLNRAPTLHRLGIQAFEPLLVEGKAIQLHPLVCTAFNADFDGDQMAVHLPLSAEAQAEARVLMLSANNVLSPAHGRPLVAPTQDMIIGSYYLTMAQDGAVGEGLAFRRIDELERAIDAGTLDLHARIEFRSSDIPDLVDAPANGSAATWHRTTAGRVFFNEALPDEFPYANARIDKKSMGVLVDDLARHYPKRVVAESLDRMKDLCFRFASRSGLTVSIDDVKTPDEKQSILDAHERDAEKVEKQFRKGIITDGERRQK